MKLDNETKIWLEDLARAGCNQRDVANQLMYRVDNANIDTPGYTPLTYEHAVNLYKSARKRVRKSSADMLIAKTQIQCGDGDQVYIASSTSVSAKPNGDPIGIFIPTEAQTMPQVNLEGPKQAPEAATPSQTTPSPSAALPEPPAKDPPAPFHELFPGLNPSAAPPLSKYVSEVIANGEQEIGTNNPTSFFSVKKDRVPNYSNVFKSEPITRDTLQAAMDRLAQEAISSGIKLDNAQSKAPKSEYEKTQTLQVKNYRHALCDYIDSVAAGGKRDPVIEESYADDAHLVDRLVLVLGPEIKSKWDNCQINRAQVESLFKFRFSEGAINTDPNNDRYDRIYEAQLGMYNGIRDLTDAVRALPISSVIAAKDETIAAKDAELETLREYVRHLQRQVGAS